MKNIVLVGGCFDILHFGHIHFLKKSKGFGDKLVVLLESDANVKRLKGKDRPIHTFKQRKETLLSIKYVDLVIKVPDKPTGKIYELLVKKIKPSVISITENDPKRDIKQKHAENVGAKLKVVRNIKNLATSQILNKIS